MYTKPEPKNKNITIRVTNKQFEAFNNTANMHGLSRSEWGYHLLFKLKKIYRKRDGSIQENNIEGTKTALIHRILEKLQIRSLYNQVTVEEDKQIKLAIKILDMTTFKSDEAIDELMLISRCSVRSSVHRSLL